VPPGPTRRRLRAAGLVVVLLLAFLGIQRLAGLDRRFLEIHSLSGVRGLAAYLIGDYAGAAAAYRRDLATWGDRAQPVPLATRALLIGDIDAAQGGGDRSPFRLLALGHPS
jgi:hypothetical protein